MVRAIRVLRERGWWDGGDGADRGFPLENCVANGMPTYVGLGQVSPPEAKRDFLERESDLVAELSRRIGYRFELIAIEAPAEMPTDEGVAVTTRWKNVGVAPIYAEVHVALALLDREGAVVDRVWLDADPTQWLPDESTTRTDTVAFSVPAGEYRLAVGTFTDPGLESPDVRLGVATERIDRWHVLTPVTAQ